MSTFVLVHGAWHGGWVWQRVAPLLRAAGHEVHTPTLTGVSDRAHLLNPSVGLGTHIEDVVALVEAYDADDVVLVGHSYGGQVVTGVADRIPDRLSLRVYLDAFVGDDGEAAIELQPETVAGHYRESVAGPGFGWLIPVRSLQVLGVTEQSDVDWLGARLTPHPWLTYTEPLRLTGAADTVPAAFVECTDWMRVFRAHAERAEARGWPVRTVATGHEAMVTAPKELADVLLDLREG
ncbi:alpha/beta hydrolase [Amycolatopsis acidiphila]|uniref:Alpha/beta hydrolase n=1 Tax=Amycolatopsis acidiphila TaxID=715473 RepID=A0A558A3G9_9PSEU|nr:alpha/beta hydrolase family protein [Amycolatopsis acidiphila]TVT18776.1 alpha/beta hydrolase [Amycolatopsis acidiphila]UIJ56968.1 alpha/beta hydrolase [Amycolatopsis acidiphila]GHG54056.1 esterase [Amycolatopsis acidiphila]